MFGWSSESFGGWMTMIYLLCIMYRYTYLCLNINICISIVYIFSTYTNIIVYPLVGAYKNIYIYDIYINNILRDLSSTNIFGSFKVGSTGGTLRGWRGSNGKKGGSWARRSLWHLLEKWWKMLDVRCCSCWFAEIVHHLIGISHPIIYRVLYIPGGARFLPSTVWV